MDKGYILEMHNISKSFPGVKALDDVTLKVKKGTVHVLVGENGAGKSTLMKIIDGVHEPDQGKIFFSNKEVHIKSTLMAIKLGISMIHQELTPIPEMTIAQNLFLGREPEYKIRGFINWRKLYSQALELLKTMELNYSPKIKVKDLSVSELQILEIIKAISYNSSLIIMDEPTSAITESEVDHLFEKINDLKARGVSIIYISHKLDEIFKIADEVTVLRDGKVIGTHPAEELDKNKIITMMVGREISNIFPKTKVNIGEEVFAVDNLKKEGEFEDITFRVKQGEILGVAGLMGAGRTEVVRAIFGLDKFDEGKILIKGRSIKIKSPRDAINNGIVMLSEDRKRYGLILCRTILENISLPNLDRYSYGILIRKRKQRGEATDIFNKLSIKAPNMEVNVNSLSGGNQQKVVIAKWLLARPGVLILDEPTRGIDVGAKYEIYKLMCELANKGIAIIMISSELPEIIGMSDRVIIMNRGKIQGEITGEEISQEKIMYLATGGRIDI